MDDIGAVRNAESSELAEAALAIVGFKLAEYEYGAAANVSGIRTKTQTFSLRRDSRTVFASDLEYGHQRRLGAWTGNGRVVVTACRRALRAAKVPTKEITAIEVLTEMGQTAERESGEKVRVHEPTQLRRVARARRAVSGIPVWSSYATVGLNAAGEVGHLELHWPEIPSLVVKEARILQELVKEGLKPPEVPGARAEGLEAGIVHSPAVGFFMDVVAAIRVIYVGDQPTVGRKPTLYLDRHGEPVALPRDIPSAEVGLRDRPKPKAYSRRSSGR